MISSSFVSMKLATRVPQNRKPFFDELATILGGFTEYARKKSWDVVAVAVYGCRPGARDLETASGPQTESPS